MGYRMALLHDPTLSRFDTIPACDRRTDDEQTHDDIIYRASIA